MAGCRPERADPRAPTLTTGTVAVDDPYDLQRFVEAQERTYAQAVDELSDGRKASHWMWFVFPQLRGLGHSPVAMRYAITSLDEARAYLAHPVLGPRLQQCVRLALRIEGQSANDIFGSPDDLKFRSCLSLFAQAAPGPSIFDETLRKYFDGVPDSRTLQLLGAHRR
jgi:uncharacterized protein (DUF1810 family)